MNVTFELCGLNDLERLIKISRITFSNAFKADNNPKDFKIYLNKAFSKEALLKELKDENSAFYFVFLKNDLAGYFKVNEFGAQSDIKDNDGFELERIYILESYQRKQIGLKVLSKVYALAKQKSKTYIWLGVWEKNQKAILWYKRNNFKKFGTHPFFIGADEQTDWLMQKEL